MNETRREKARRLRYTKPVVKGITLDDIRDALYEMSERCSEAQYLADNDADVLTAALCGDENDFYEFRMELSDLEAQVEQMLEDLHETYIPELFDDFFVSVNNCHEELLGYDSYEQDYYGLNVYEYKYATEESRKRMERHTKKEILDTMAICFNIYISFISLRTRYDSLTAALDILRDQNFSEIRGAQNLNELYEKFCGDAYRYGSELERVAQALPAEAWLR